MLHSERSFWQRLVHGVVQAGSGVPLQHFLMCENNITKSGPFGFLFEIPNFSFVAIVSQSVAIAFRHLAGADILVSTGSSFAIAAALCAPRVQIHVACAPKEGGSSDVVHYMQESVPVSPTGEILPVEAASLRRRIQHLYLLKPKPE